MSITEKFYLVRDIPYRIPLSVSDPDQCCSGKAEQLLNFFKESGYEARYRMCSFLWNKLNLPEQVTRAPHEDESTHVWVELRIQDNWVAVDATWDKGLGSVFKINEWDGKSNTSVAVPILRLFSPEESEKVMVESAQEKEILADLEKNVEFYAQFNNWLQDLRTNSK